MHVRAHARTLLTVANDENLSYNMLVDWKIQ
jgi:hypothetical protein